MSAKIPKHIGIILDGNRRWAKENKLPKLEGHRAGYENIKGISEHAFNEGVEYITAYIFSTENWNRSKEEVDYLMNLLPIVFKKYLDYFIKNEVRIHWLGCYDKLGKKEIKLVEDAVEKTKDFKKKNLCFCFNYGGRREIIDAFRKMHKDGVDVENISDESLHDYLYAPEVPNVDLIIRTSGEQRISNFMLWRAAYSELIFINKYWPAFKEADLDSVLHEYGQRQRRFGC